MPVLGCEHQRRSSGFLVSGFHICPGIEEPLHLGGLPVRDVLLRVQMLLLADLLLLLFLPPLFSRQPLIFLALGGQAIEQAHKPSLGAATAIGLLAAIVVLLITFGSFVAMLLISYFRG